LNPLHQRAKYYLGENPLRCLILLAALLTITHWAHPQGCAQCRDNAAATPQATQAAYRHAIILLVVTAGTLFTGTVFLLKRSR